MQLITGGTGFIGTHVARALLDMEESCVVTRHRAERDLSLVRDRLGTQLFIEPLDVADRDGLLRLGTRHAITGIVHLASGPAASTADPFEDAHAALQGLLNVLFAAGQWGVGRVSIASTIGVYGGVKESVFREDAPLPLSATHPIPTFKKVSELLAGFIGGRIGVEVVQLRIGAAWGPLGRPASLFFALPGMVHSALTAAPAAAGTPPIYAEDGSDLCYVKDVGRAIARVQLARKLNHGVYNVGSGRATTNREVAAAIRSVVPDAKIELAEGHDPRGPGGPTFMDIFRIRADARYEPGYDIRSGIADYVAWLRAGNER